MSDLSQIKTALEESNAKYSKYFAEKNSKAITELYTENPECVLIEPHGPPGVPLPVINKGREAVGKSLEAFWVIGATNICYNMFEMTPLDSPYKYVCQRGEVTTTIKGETSTGWFVIIWLSVDGVWKRYIETFAK